MSGTEEFIVGQSFNLKASFVDDNDAPADPTVVTLKILDSAGVQTTFVFGTDAEVVKTATGEYKSLFVQALTGWHSADWIGTGTIDAVERLAWNGLAKLF